MEIIYCTVAVSNCTIVLLVMQWLYGSSIMLKSGGILLCNGGIEYDM